MVRNHKVFLHVLFFLCLKQIKFFHRNNQEAQTIIASFRLFYVQDVAYAAAICQDSRFRVWNLKTGESTQEDLSRYLSATEAISWGRKTSS